MAFVILQKIFDENENGVLGTQVKNTVEIGVVEDPMEAEVAQGYTMAQFCDKIIDLFLNEKPKVKEWKKYLVLRDEWNKYSLNFYKRCRTRADTETDPLLKQRLVSLESKVKKVGGINLYFVKRFIVVT